MRNNNILYLFLIFISALLFRLWFIDKPEGLWNDEYVSWAIASEKNFSAFISNMMQNCHVPLYYFYLKSWIALFNDSDISLRLSSVLPSILSIYIIFLCGKELKDEKVGLFAAFLTAINSFNIYFAQEVRLYSLLMLFSSFSLLYFIKTVKVQSKTNLILFIVSNCLICAVHTLGIIYAFFNTIILFALLYKYNSMFKAKFNNILKVLKYLLPFIVTAIILIPLIFTIAFSNNLSQFWSDFSILKIFFIFTDYFSPVEINIINTPNTLTHFIFSEGGINYAFIIFISIPFLTAIIAFINGILKKNIALNAIIISSFAFLISVIALAITGKLILITKYTCEIYPVLILTIAYGFIEFKQKKLKSALIILFIGLNISYLLLSDYSAPKIVRSEGHRCVVKLLEDSKLKSSDFVILTYYNSDRFEKYLKDKTQYNFSSVNKFNFNTIIYNNEDYYDTIKYGKKLYKNELIKFPNKNIVKYLNDNFISKMKKGQRIGIIFLDSVSFLTNEEIEEIINNEKDFERTPFIFLTFSALKNNLLASFDDNFRIEGVTSCGNWTLIVYKRN